MSFSEELQREDPSLWSGLVSRYIELVDSMAIAEDALERLARYPALFEAANMAITSLTGEGPVSEDQDEDEQRHSHIAFGVLLAFMVAADAADLSSMPPDPTKETPDNT